MTSDFAEVVAFLTQQLRRPLPGAEAQLAFAPRPPRDGWSPDLRPGTARHAAALVLIYPGTTGPAIPLTLRHAALPHHAGQVSLPGGAIDPGESPEEAAIREAHEEIGVTADHLRLLGPMSTLWVPISNFVIHPFVATADRRPDFRPHVHEVETLIEVPLTDLRDRSRIKWASRDRRDVQIDYPYFDVGGQVVWGATAMILAEFTALFEDQ